MSCHPKLASVNKRMFAAKAERKLSFEDIGRKIGHDEVYVAALFYGQAKPSQEEMEKLSSVLNIPTSHLKEELGDQYFPDRGGLVDIPPSDPTLYRLFEIIKVYGYPLKAIIHEKFGDGIMSAIDFSAHVDKVPHPKGDRVKITLEGKFLSFAKW
ncbi:cyanate hydratase [Phycomyces nitens]|nr:cyanate hydratase [Phycomyces nitens]